MSKTLKMQILTTARALIADKKHWTQNAFARNARGRHVCPTDEDAIRFCAVGAIARAYRVCTGEYNWEKIPGIPLQTLDRLETISEIEGHAAILEAFDKLISAA